MTPAIAHSFQHELNMRPQLQSYKSCYASHGANLSVALSALRSCNGQLCGEQRRRELGVQTRTGEGRRYINLESYAGFRFVCAANTLHENAIEVCERYARIETGHGLHYWGKPRLVNTSEASSIGVVMLGETVDPNGKGARHNDDMFLNISQELFDTYYKHWPAETRASMPTREAFCKAHAFQIIAERMNIRAILVFDPLDPSKDDSLQFLVKELVKQVSFENGNRYADIYVGLYRQKVEQLKAVFERNGTRITIDDFVHCVFDDVSYPISKHPQSAQVEKEMLLCAYAAMILFDAELVITAEKISNLILAAGYKNDSDFPVTIAKFCAKQDVSKLLNYEGDASGLVAVAVAALTWEAEAVADEKKQEVEDEEEEEELLDFTLFD